MDKISIMTVPCGFKIKKKCDVQVFINGCMNKDNEYYLKINDELAIIIIKEKNGSVSVLEKTGDLCDIFNPLLEVACSSNNFYKCTVEYYIWKYRKYINKKWFSK